MPSRNRIAALIPAMLLVALAIAGAEAETAYLRKALGLEIGFSCADWLEIYEDMSENMNISEQLARVEEHTSPLDMDGYAKYVLDYDSAKSAGISERILELSEQMIEFHNAMAVIAVEGEARYSGTSERMTIFDIEISEYPKVHAYLSMLDSDGRKDCR